MRNLARRASNKSRYGVISAVLLEPLPDHLNRLLIGWAKSRLRRQPIRWPSGNDFAHAVRGRLVARLDRVGKSAIQVPPGEKSDLPALRATGRLPNVASPSPA